LCEFGFNKSDLDELIMVVHWNSNQKKMIGIRAGVAIFDSSYSLWEM